jgi:tRNA-splicing ligase RtcB|nr:MAG TPA: tRNA-splicing ligase RtcB [Caudoviricetes sp.]
MVNLKIFTENIEQKALSQIYNLIKQPAFSECKVRIMPDVHAGTGCVIGFTADLGEKVIPNIVGVDIGCGMLTTNLGNIDIDFARLDNVIREYVPSGRSVHKEESLSVASDIIEKMYCKEQLNNIDWLKRSCGTLGGGNHFIEVDIDSKGNKYLVIHSGSRNVGKQVAEIYQQIAIDDISGKSNFKQDSEKLIAEYKKIGREREINNAIKELKQSYEKRETKIPRELSYLVGEHREMYLHDMKLCQDFAEINRRAIQSVICYYMSWEVTKETERFQTIHNYIEHETNIVRKGAISAKAGEKLLIPINMRDGCILGIGKGNEDWNYSAPHGAGRIMSRSKAKEIVSLEEYKKSMNGIFTTSVNTSTIDESPMAYKSINEIMENIKDTVEVVDIIKPIYNFKASE